MVRQEPSKTGEKRKVRVLPNIMRRIAADILTGRIAVGTSLPPESEMAATLGVSRSVVREALKVLAAKGFLQSKPRVGTVIRDSEHWNLLDQEVMEWHGPTLFDRKLLDAMLETRTAFEPFVAQLAASRASLRELADLESALVGMSEAGDDTEAFSRADIEFHRALYGAAHNPFLQRIGNLVDAALKYSIETTAESTTQQRAEAVSRHRAVIEALRVRDGNAAEAATREIIKQAATDIELAAQKRMNQSTQDQDK